jgi:transposase
MTFREIDDELWEIVQRHLPPQKPHIGRPRRDPRHLFNGVVYVLSTGCAWSDVPAEYGTKSTVHRYHLELCERGTYQAIFLDLIRSGYEFRKGEPGRCVVEAAAVPGQH